MAQIKIYGQFGDHWSNAVVSRGLAAGLAQNGMEVAVADSSNIYSDLWGGDFECGVDVGAPIGMFVGYPVRGGVTGHKFTVGALICESSIIPEDWALMAKAYDLIIVPSKWTKMVYSRSGVPENKIMVVNHGLHDSYENSDPNKSGKTLKFLHISGARDFLDRKGTPQLIKAFAKVFGDDNSPMAKLVIRSPASLRLYELIDRTWKPHLFEVDGSLVPFSPDDMIDYYGQKWSALIQPSRAESFGICPIEARMMNIPVILTSCTGHSEHFNSSLDIYVEHGEDKPIEVNGIPSGMAPEVTSDSIEASLRVFLSIQKNLKKVENREKYFNKFSWKSVTYKLFSLLNKKLLDNCHT